jgi:hypothetical protein
MFTNVPVNQGGDLHASQMGILKELFASSFPLQAQSRVVFVGTLNKIISGHCAR